MHTDATCECFPAGSLASDARRGLVARQSGGVVKGHSAGIDFDGLCHG